MIKYDWLKMNHCLVLGGTHSFLFQIWYSSSNQIFDFLRCYIPFKALNADAMADAKSALDVTGDPGTPCIGESQFDLPFQWQLYSLHTVDIYCLSIHASISIWKLSSLLFGPNFFDLNLCAGARHNSSTLVIHLNKLQLHKEAEG